MLAADIELGDTGVACSGWSSLAEGRGTLPAHQLERVSESRSVGMPLEMAPACQLVIVHRERRLMAVEVEEERFVLGTHSVAGRATVVGMKHVGVDEGTPDD